MKPNNLGARLHLLRGFSGMSLRDVEREAGVSSAYIRQIETGKAKNPNPGILRRLADVYQVDYRSLLESAGYLDDRPRAQCERNAELEAFLRDLDLCPEEQEAVMEFIKFILWRRSER